MKTNILDEKNSNIIFKAEIEEMVYKTDINSFVTESGVTIQNVSFPIKKAYYINLSNISKTLICGNIIENLFLELQKNNVENSLLVVDFNGVKELSKSFYEGYTKVLLQTSNKIITINMDTQLSNEFSAFVLSNIQEVEE